jgi:hypothetical protein
MYVMTLVKLRAGIAGVAYFWALAAGLEDAAA